MTNSHPILIPLDGSEPSDRIVGPVTALARQHPGTEIHLLRVLQPFERSASDSLERPAGSNPLLLLSEAAREHLLHLAERLEEVGCEVRRHVLLGEPAELILDLADRLDPLVIAMSTHGRTGLDRLLRGSVTERILRKTRSPLLALNTSESERPAAAPLRLRRILVPLDGSERSLQILPLVESFALAFEAEVVLLEVVDQITPPLAPTGLPLAGPWPIWRGVPTPDAIADELSPQVEALEAVGVPTRVRVERGEAAERILASAEALNADLIALTTHGRSGLDRLLCGSVAETVLRRSSRPVLVKRSAPIPQLART